MQLWMEINVVTLHKFLETMPRRMRAIIKSKGPPNKYEGVTFFFGRAVCVFAPCGGHLLNSQTLL